MTYKLLIASATYNVGSVTEELTFDTFYDMADYLEGEGINDTIISITEIERV